MVKNEDTKSKKTCSAQVKIWYIIEIIASEAQLFNSPYTIVMKLRQWGVRYHTLNIVHYDIVTNLYIRLSFLVLWVSAPLLHKKNPFVITIEETVWSWLFEWGTEYEMSRNDSRWGQTQHVANHCSMGMISINALWSDWAFIGLYWVITNQTSYYLSSTHLFSNIINARDKAVKHVLYRK